jgi:hypothetical protein
MFRVFSKSVIVPFGDGNCLSPVIVSELAVVCCLGKLAGPIGALSSRSYKPWLTYPKKTSLKVQLFVLFNCRPSVYEVKIAKRTDKPSMRDDLSRCGEMNMVFLPFLVSLGLGSVT